MARRPTTTQEAIQQCKPFRSLAQEATVALLLTSDALRRRFASALEAHDITAQQYNVLRILRGAGADGLPTLAIGERMLERTPGVTRLIDRLIAKRLVVRGEAPNDRRQVLCMITAAGLDMLAGLDAPVDNLDEEMVACLSAAELSQLVALLDRIRNAQPE